MAKLTYDGPFGGVDVIYEGASYTAPNGSEVELPDELAALLTDEQGEQWSATAPARNQTTGATAAGEGK